MIWFASAKKTSQIPPRTGKNTAMSDTVSLAATLQGTKYPHFWRSATVRNSRQVRMVQDPNTEAAEWQGPSLAVVVLGGMKCPRKDARPGSGAKWVQCPLPQMLNSDPDSRSMVNLDTMADVLMTRISKQTLISKSRPNTTSRAPSSTDD